MIFVCNLHDETQRYSPRFSISYRCINPFSTILVIFVESVQGVLKIVRVEFHDVVYIINRVVCEMIAKEKKNMKNYNVDLFTYILI